MSKASLEHWIPVEATVLYQENPTKPVPKGVVPDPPNYTACVAYLKSTPQKGARQTGPPPSIAAVRAKCSRRYAEVKELTLNTLLGWYWTIKAGETLGIKVSDAEVKQRLKEVNGHTYATPAEFTNFLKLTGQTVPDMMLRSRVQIYEVKLTARLAAMEKALPKGLTPQQQQAAAAKFVEYVSPSKEWAARTTCLKGYVVSACKEYTGSEPPGIPN